MELEALEPIEVKAAAFASKWGLAIGAGLILLVLVLGWWWWNSHMTAKNAAAVPKAAAKVNAAQASAGGAAVNTVQGNQTKAVKTDQTTRNVTNVFNTYPAAKAEIDPGFVAAFDRGICMYRSAASLPECQRLLQPDSK